MNSRLGQGNLELKVTDFGPIAKAELDLRPLTVFVGPSNTGKSYLAILIYALQRYFSDVALSGRQRPNRPYRRYWGLPSQETTDALVGMVQERIAKNTNLPVRDDIVLPAPVLDYFRSGLDEQSDDIGNEIVGSVGATDVGSLVRKGSSEGARVVLKSRVSNDAEPIEHRLALKAQGPEFRTMIPKEREIAINSGVARYLDHVAEERDFTDPPNRR